jgi:hypothetical protein
VHVNFHYFRVVLSPKIPVIKEDLAMAAFLRRMANSSHMSVELNNMMEILSDHQEFDAGQFATINRITSMNSCEYETCSNRE